MGRQTYLPMSLVNSLAGIGIMCPNAPYFSIYLSNARQLYSAVVEYTGG
jgi:hypothetical protein